MFEARRIKCDSVSGRKGFKAAGYPRKEGENSALLLIAYRYRAVPIRFGVVRLVVRAQERYTLGGPGGMLPQEI